MTGFGEARIQDDRWSVGVEVRTVNNRHLKLSAKISDPYGALEPDFERLVRETIRRLGSAIVATAHGHAMLMLDGTFGSGPRAAEAAAQQAAAATLALISGRDCLTSSAADRLPRND